MNFPTGLLLLWLGRFIPESAKFLLARGRKAEAQVVMQRFGTVSHSLAEGEQDESELIAYGHSHILEEEAQLWTPALIGKTAALSIFIALTLLGLLWIVRLDTHLDGNPVWAVGLLIIGSNGIIAILLPYASESYPIKIRARATGWVAMCTKAGGVLAQCLSIAALVPSIRITAVIIMVPVTLSLALFLRYGTETRGLDLRYLEGRPQ